MQRVYLDFLVDNWGLWLILLLTVARINYIFNKFDAKKVDIEPLICLRVVVIVLTQHLMISSFVLGVVRAWAY